MGILKGIIKTAKDLYNADANDKLVEYVGEKISDVVKKYDGTAEEEFETQKEKIRNQILDELNYEEFDNEYCQTLIDRFLNEYASSDDDYVYGLISMYDSNSNTYTVEGISENVDISKGADVVTTGMGTVFPSGLMIGKVKDVTTDNFDLSKVVEVEASVDFDDLDYVTVLKRVSD